MSTLGTPDTGSSAPIAMKKKSPPRSGATVGKVQGSAAKKAKDPARSAKRAAPKKTPPKTSPAKESTAKTSTERPVGRAPRPKPSLAEPSVIAANDPLVLPVGSGEDPPPDAELILPVVDPVGYRRLVTNVFKRYFMGLRKNWKRTAICAAVGGALGWLANVAMMAFGSGDGYTVIPGAAASGQGNIVRGASFWFVASMIISAVVNHWIRSGSERFFHDMGRLPATIRSLVSDDGSGALTHALFGFAGAMLITYVLGSSLSGALAIGAVIALATVARPVIVGGLLIAWQWVVSRITPQQANRTPIQAVTVATLGGAGAMAAAVIVNNSTIRMGLALVAIVAAIVLSQQKRSVGGTAMLVLFGGAIASVLLNAHEALADDGGWRECGSSLSIWMACSGSDRVRWLAAFGGAGSAIGSGLGSGLVNKQPEPVPPDWRNLPSGDKQQFIDDYIAKYKQTHKGYTPEKLQRFVDLLHDQPPGFWENRWNGIKNFWGSYAEDVASGKQAEGLGATFFGIYEGFTNAGGALWDEVKQLPATAWEMPGVMWDDPFGGLPEAGTAIIETGDKVIKAAGTFAGMTKEQRQEAYDKFGKENVEAFMRRAKEFEQALINKDPSEIRRSIGQIAGALEFEVMLGWGTTKGGQAGAKFVQESGLGERATRATAEFSGKVKGAKDAGTKAASDFADKMKKNLGQPFEAAKAEKLRKEALELGLKEHAHKRLTGTDQAFFEFLSGADRGAVERVAKAYMEDMGKYLPKGTTVENLADKWQGFGQKYAQGPPRPWAPGEMAAAMKASDAEMDEYILNLYEVTAAKRPPGTPDPDYVLQARAATTPVEEVGGKAAADAGNSNSSWLKGFIKRGQGRK